MSSVSTDPPTYVQRENDNEENSGKDRLALKEKVISQDEREGGQQEVNGSNYYYYSCAMQL